MKTIISAANDVNINAARHIKALLDEKPDAAIAFSVGRSMDGLFTALAAMSAAGEVSFAAAKVFTVGISTPNCAPPGNVASEVGRECRSPPGRPRVRRNALDLSIITASLLVLRDTEKV